MEELISRLRAIDAHWEPALAQDLCRQAADAIEKLQNADRAGGERQAKGRKLPPLDPPPGQS